MVQTNVSQNCELPTSTHQKKKNEKEPSSRANKECFDVFLKGKTDDTA